MILRTLLLFSLLCSAIATAALPTWTDEDRALLESGKLEIGLGLLPPKKLSAGEAGTPLDRLQDIPVTPAVGARPDLHPDPVSPDERTPLSSRFLKLYFDKPIAEGISDPQQILSSQEKLDTGYALSLLAEESPVPVYFYIFERNQKVPREFSAKNIFKRHYSHLDSAVVIYYFLNEPNRCQVYFGGKETSSVPKYKIQNLITGVKSGAKRRSNPISQLDEFIRQLSLNLFWIEKAMLENSYASISQNEDPVSDSKKPSMLEKALPALAQLSNYSYVVLAGSLAFIAILVGAVYYIRHRRFTLPILEHRSRLNLPAGGGIGGVLGYDDQNKPASAQREQFSNPL